MSEIYKPPMQLPQKRLSVFLAGSIEMGKAENWQSKVEEALKDYPVDIFNPRRDDWDSSWEQSIKNIQFCGQVNWELDALERADHIIMYFSPETMSPISLLELGLFAQSRKLSVVCPEGFWRKGNVDVVCQRYNIPQFTNIENLLYNLTYYW